MKMQQNDSSDVILPVAPVRNEMTKVFEIE